MRYHSFVIRLWHREEDPENNGTLHGRIEHVQSNAVALFSSLAEAADFIRLHSQAKSETDEHQDER